MVWQKAILLCILGAVIIVCVICKLASRRRDKRLDSATSAYWNSMFNRSHHKQERDARLWGRLVELEEGRLAAIAGGEDPGPDHAKALLEELLR